MESIAPFGSGNTSDVPVQKFMGATVSKFNCSADFASQPGSCSIDLVVDDTQGDVFAPGVIGSPYYFKIVDINGDTIFGFNGVLESISRESSPENKLYKVTLLSPLKILEAVTLIIDGYTGYGSALEGLPRYFSDDGYYQIEDSDKQPGYLPDGVSMTPTVSYFETAQFSFATNNANLSFTGMWNRSYNLINVFAAYENEWVDGDGNSLAVVPFAGFGASSVTSGMRVDKIAYAIDEIVNRTEATSPRRYIGGNLMYGANTYNICGTASGYVPPYPFFYGFDIIGFVSSVLNYLPEDFVIPGPSISIAEFIAIICDTINADFIVELNDSSYKNGAFAASMSQTYPNSVFGGIISILLIPKNQYVTCSKPFSQFTYDLLNLEKPDTGDYASSGNVNPGIPPTDDGRFINPLDLDYVRRGTEGSVPYGGRFPVTPTPTEILNSITNRPVNLSVSLKSTNPTVGKMVVGGYQTRMNIVPRDYIYQYWGEITLVTASGDACGVTRNSQKSIPVITQTLPPNDVWDWIAIDIQHIVSSNTATGAFYDGIYFASMLEVRAAMSSYEAWVQFMESVKSHKWEILNGGAVDTIVGRSTPQYVSTILKYQAFVGLGNTTNAQSSFERPSVDGILNKIWQKVKDIGDTHYGKSWVAPIPVFQTKMTQSGESLVGNFVRSWDVSDSAYVEPYAYGQMEAPKDSAFIQDGRLKAFANFEHSFTAGGDDDVAYGLLTGSLTGFASGVKYKFDFSEHSSSTTFDLDPSATGNCPTIGLAHVQPSIDEKYIFVPSQYFDYYNRGHCPFIDTVDTSGAVGQLMPYGSFYLYTYSYNNKSITRGASSSIPNNAINDSNSKNFATSGDIVGSMTKFKSNGFFGYPSSYDTYGLFTTVYTPSSSLFNHDAYSSGYYIQEIQSSNDFGIVSVQNAIEPATGIYTAHFSFHYSGTALKDILGGIVSNPANDTGSGLPFIKFTTDPVYYPSSFQTEGINPIDGSYVDHMAEMMRAERFFALDNGHADIASFGETFGGGSSSRAAVSPRSIGIPQRSNRYVYGPWMTNSSETIYCGKMEYEQNEELVPENFMIPVYGTISTNWQVVDTEGNVTRSIDSVNGTSLSGFAGMNLAGQAIANSIDDFSLFAQEEGNLTLNGLPIITRVGQTLSNGPRITDISISFDNSQVQTTYNFRTLSPRAGKNSKELLKQLRKISNTIRNK
jgi:hypothetical protein